MAERTVTFCMMAEAYVCKNIFKKAVKFVGEWSKLFNLFLKTRALSKSAIFNAGKWRDIFWS